MAGERAHEFELIERYLAPLATDPGSVGLVDDAAVLSPAEGEDLVLTKDALAADIHFFTVDPAGAIAQKALRVNLSDLAAKGARPLGYLLGLALAPDWDERWVADFCAGLKADQEAYGFPLYGGDTIKVSAGPVLSVTAIGALPRGSAVRRSSARAGDRLYVTGTIGDAALGLALRHDRDKARAWGLDAAQTDHLLQRYLLPEPRTQAAEAVRLHARASMDISDGLVGDLAKMAGSSGVGAEIDLDAVPLSDAAALTVRDDAAFVTAMTGGDDYELLVAVAPEKTDAFEAAVAQSGVSLSRIGRIEAGAKVSYRRAGEVYDFGAAAGYSHF
ncbi:thiamine-phosphate kinase [Breoghania corrubedonensis]|uniref:Thiamine-monophosphate kinase n=1 Tax=Breoghania corrubedonensis TaxID=665038 RepID=A0A2T5VC20_9HYPH|nr:thiamine-phosphate kinase [Breoghania corrubedonensis]PTW61295.1 thiamine-phosphate kinase [Breoghania corrubedonensis]